MTNDLRSRYFTEISPLVTSFICTIVRLWLYYRCQLWQRFEEKRMVTEKSSNLFANLFVYTEKIDTMIKKMFWSCVSVVKEKCYAFSYLCQLQSNFNESRLKYKQITQSLQCNGIKTRIQQSTKNVAKKETKWMNTWHA